MPDGPTEVDVTRTRRLTALLIAVASAASLSGCALITPREAEQEVSALERCVAAHPWEVDVATLAANSTLELTQHGIGIAPATATGTQTLTYVSGEGTLELESDFTVTGVWPGPPVVQVVQTFTGTSTGKAFFADDVMIPRDWNDDGVQTTLTATQDGAPLDPVPWSLGHPWIDDVVGLVATCDDTKLTLEGRTTQRAWTFYAPGTAPTPAG